VAVKLDAVEDELAGDGAGGVFESKREAPRPRTVAAIFLATISGEPTHNEPTATSRSNSAGVVGGQPRSDPIRLRIT
jgi:hypothetical protein